MRFSRKISTIPGMREFLVGACVLLMGCGGEESCEPLSGLYRASLTERGGTCGPVPSSLVRIGDADTSGCTGTRPGPCGGAVDMTCPGSPGTFVRMRGELEPSVDSSGQPGMRGEVQIEILNGAGTVCRGDYILRYTKA